VSLLADSFHNRCSIQTLTSFCVMASAQTFRRDSVDGAELGLGVPRGAQGVGAPLSTVGLTGNLAGEGPALVASA
jgi:hypothetical protein